jgi:hypothetical protein
VFVPVFVRLLEQLLAEEDVEVLVPLVGHVDDVGVLAGCLTFHFWCLMCLVLIFEEFELQFNNAIAFSEPFIINYTRSIL